MAKALTREARDKKVATQQKIVNKLVDQLARATKTIATVNQSLALEQARLENFKATPVVEDFLPTAAAPADPEPEATEPEATEPEAQQEELSFA
jgi:hypothetical protein